MTRPHPDQRDLFEEPIFEARRRADGVDMERFRSKLKRAMARAIRECPHDRHAVALRMARALGLDGFSKATLDAYTAESKATHDISLVRFTAFVRATGADWLWDEIVATEGLTVLQSDEALLAEIGRLQQEQAEIARKLRSLKARPVPIRRRPKP